jgi:hypothetical protein
VEPEMYDYTSYNWSHWNGNEKLTDKSGSNTRKTFDRFTTADSCTGNITHNAESAAVWDWSVSGGGHRWFKGSTWKNRTVTSDYSDDVYSNNNNNKNGNTLIMKTKGQTGTHTCCYEL